MDLRPGETVFSDSAAARWVREILAEAAQPKGITVVRRGVRAHDLLNSIIDNRLWAPALIETVSVKGVETTYRITEKGRQFLAARAP